MNLSLFFLQAFIFWLHYLIFTEHLLLAGIALNALPALTHLVLLNNPLPLLLAFLFTDTHYTASQ